MSAVAKVAVARTKFAKGFDGTGSEVPAAYEVLVLEDALQRTYDTDAHLVSYVVDGMASQPRINKTGLPYFEGSVRTTVFFCDVDNPGHAEWSDELSADAMKQYESLNVLSTCGVYHTAHGRRFVQPLAEPIVVAEVEPYLRRWLLGLENAGLAVDWACRDWTRHFRLPHVRRNGKTYRSPLVALERMRAIPLEPILTEDAPSDPAPTAPRAARTPAAIAWSSELPATWSERAAAIAKAVHEGVTENWHDMYLALGGALLARGCPPERLPALIEWIATCAGSEKPASHGRSARDTARRYVERLQTTGHRTLVARWPGVAAAVDDVTARRTEARLRAQAKGAPEAPPLADAVAALTQAIRKAPDGLSVISAECGIGKTQAAMVVAAERALTPHASPYAKGTRAPLFSKTSISVDKNSLAEQITRDLRARGTPVVRVFGPLSVLRDDGTPECRYHEIARPLVEGGQSVRRELCEGREVERCEFYDVCKAKDGLDGPDHARVTVGPHALLGELDAAAGSTGLLVIDEPPALLETVALSREDFAAARARLDSFEGTYASAMRPAVEELERWIDLAEPEVVTDPVAALKQMLGDRTSDVIAAIEKAIPEKRASKAPPIRRSDIFVAKKSLTFATSLGTASLVLGTLYAALLAKKPVAMRVEERGRAHALVFTSARDEFTEALRRQGSCVVTDANAEIHLPVLAKIVGYPPRFTKFAAADGAPIQRTLLRCRSATRRGWFSHGKVVLDAGVVAAVRAAFAWAAEDSACRSLGIITMRLLRLLLEAAARPTDTNIDDQWRDLRQPKRALEEAREKLAPTLQGWPGTLSWGHYGAVRGLNSMADVDALITIGDPWPNVGEVRNDVAFLGLQAAWEERLEAMCRAELEQAHGRLRPVHRARPGRALHIGNVLPSGYGWTSGGVDIRTQQGGRPSTRSTMSPDDMRAIVRSLGGLRPAAAVLGCTPATVSRYCSGDRPIPEPVAIAIQKSA